MNDINLADCTVNHLTISEIGDIEGEKPEATLARWSDQFNPVSRNPTFRFAYTLARDFHTRRMYLYSTPEPVTISYTCESGKSGIQSIPFYATSSSAINTPDDIYPIRQFYNTTTSSSLTSQLDAAFSSLHSNVSVLTHKNETNQEFDTTPEELHYGNSYIASRILKGK